MSGKVIPFLLKQKLLTYKSRCYNLSCSFLLYISLFPLTFTFSINVKLAENHRMYYYAQTHGTNSWKFKKLLVELLRHRYFYGLLRSSRSQMFFKIGVLKNFANFTGKNLHQSLFLRKLQAPRLLCRLQTPCRPSSSFY